jgi:hypothetical protein
LRSAAGWRPTRTPPSPALQTRATTPAACWTRMHAPPPATCRTEAPSTQSALASPPSTTTAWCTVRAAPRGRAVTGGDERGGGGDERALGAERRAKASVVLPRDGAGVAPRMCAGRDPPEGELIPWCTSYYSTDCAAMQSKYQDRTRIVFVANADDPSQIVEDVPTEVAPPQGEKMTRVRYTAGRSLSRPQPYRLAKQPVQKVTLSTRLLSSLGSKLKWGIRFGVPQCKQPGP